MAVEATEEEKVFVGEFLKDNKVKTGWENLILKNDSVLRELSIIIQEQKLRNKDEANERCAPEANNILRAFAHCEPEDIKVVIIGTSPITKGMANGLSFSSDRHENKFDGKQGAAIRKVHDALREAKILDKGVNYYCGHEEWATEGVLLLNAALTINWHSDKKDIIHYHCLKWKSFLRCLLKKWIKETKLTPTISVMLWGYSYDKNYPNYAEKVWEDIVPQDCNVFKVYSAHHPTWPYKGNNFSDTVSAHFRELPDESRQIFMGTKFQD